MIRKIIVFIVLITLSLVECKKGNTKQFPLSKETNPPNFIRLVVMRLIYGLASSMGLEDRLEDVFGGIFVPPGADDYGDYGGFDDYTSDFI
ncbi:GSCOCG00008099001-RA-CDS [Cotesia congregata]|nr:GSCOCG00008099001-RA-CDS [Cotesia congregata]